MIETVKALPGLIKDWRSNSDLIYQLVGCLAGGLTIAAYVRGQRPSEVLAAAMYAIGASGVGGWFESGLPPLLAEPHVEASRALVSLSALAVLTMLIKQFFNAKRDDWPIDLQARGLLGSRAAVTGVAHVRSSTRVHSVGGRVAAFTSACCCDCCRRDRFASRAGICCCAQTPDAQPSRCGWCLPRPHGGERRRSVDHDGIRLGVRRHRASHGCRVLALYNRV